MHVGEKASPMYIMITSKGSPSASLKAVQKAEEMFKEILVRFLKNSNDQYKEQLLEELASGMVHKCRQLGVTDRSQTLERTLSGLSGTTHPRDDTSLDCDRPRKLARAGPQNELTLPLWVTRKEGWFGALV